MRTLLFSTLLLLLFLAPPMASGQGHFSIDVTITRVQDMNAPLIIGLYSSEDDFKQRIPLDSLHIIPRADSVKISFNDVAEGTYAIALFQDIHGTGKLTTKEFGIPTEPVGVSNYPLPGIPAPPRFNKASFVVDGNRSMVIPLMFARDYENKDKTP